MLGPSDLLLSVKQSLSCAWVLRPDACEKQTLRRYYKCRTEPEHTMASSDHLQ